MMENQKKHTLGSRAFLLFFFRKLKWVFFLFIFSGIIFYSERWLTPNATDTIWVDYIARVILALSFAYLAFVLAEAWLEYRYYTYMFTDEAFIMTYGYIMRNEVSALYHQIQNVNILRSPWDRLSGVSQIVIFMTGSEKDSTHNKIVLPAVGKTKAKLVQKELLVRARRHVPSSDPE